MVNFIVFLEENTINNLETIRQKPSWYNGLMEKIPFLPTQKISWIILFLFFAFDDVFSYYAVTRMGGHEANKLIAFAVEKYPPTLRTLSSS